MLLRGSLSQDWIKFLPKVVESYNHTPSKKLGGIAPETIHSEIDSVRVAEAQKQTKVKIHREPNFHIQIQNEEKYKKNSQNLQEGAYVYLSTNEDLFAKSYDVKVKFCLASNQLSFRDKKEIKFFIIVFILRIQLSYEAVSIKMHKIFLEHFFRLIVWYRSVYACIRFSSGFFHL